MARINQINKEEYRKDNFVNWNDKLKITCFNQFSIIWMAEHVHLVRWKVQLQSHSRSSLIEDQDHQSVCKSTKLNKYLFGLIMLVSRELAMGWLENEGWSVTSKDYDNSLGRDNHHTPSLNHSFAFGFHSFDPFELKGFESDEPLGWPLQLRWWIGFTFKPETRGGI